MKRWQLVSLFLIATLICLPDLSISQPRIRVEPENIDFDDWREAGQFQERQLTIFNDGNEDLRWIGEVEILQEPDGRGPRRDNPGDLIGRFRKDPNEHVTPAGYDPDNERMWHTNTDDETVSAFSFDDEYQNFREEMRLNAGAAIDGAWARGLLYLPPFNSNVINRFNGAGQNIGAVEMPFPIGGLAADDEEGWLFLMSAEDGAIHVFDLEDDGGIGDQIGVIDNHLEYHNNSDTYGFEWVSKHPDGQLWMVAPNSGRVHQISVDTDNWQCTAEIQNFIVFPNDEEPLETTISHDGHHMWAGGFFEDDIRIYDDGITEAYWLMVEGLEGIVRPGSDQAVDVYFDATGLLGGDYSAILRIESNDPANAHVEIMISAIVVGVPDIVVEWQNGDGFPNIMDFNMRFDDIVVGEPYSFPFIIRNEGNDDLEILEIITGNPIFTVNFREEIILAPDEWREIEIVFRAEEEGEWDELLMLMCNDPEAGEFSIPLHARTFPPPPIITIDTEVIECELGWREVQEFALNIANDGEANLRWLGEITGLQDNVQLIIDPIQGEIEAGADQDVMLRVEFIESDSLPSEFDLTFFSNDPETPEKIVHIVVQTLNVESAMANLPTSTRLVSLYPNPFNSSTTISFAVGAQGLAPLRMAIYGVDGRLVENLIGGLGSPSYAPGYHNLVWNAGGIPAGSYLVRFEAGEGAVQEQWVRLVK